jgi:hypothetical protein
MFSVSYDVTCTSASQYTCLDMLLIIRFLVCNVRQVGDQPGKLPASFFVCESENAETRLNLADHSTVRSKS